MQQAFWRPRLRVGGAFTVPNIVDAPVAGDTAEHPAEVAAGVAAAVAHLKEARGMTAAQVGRVSNPRVDPMTLYRLARRETVEPRLRTVIGLANAFDTTPDDLLILAGLWRAREPETHIADAAVLH